MKSLLGKLTFLVSILGIVVAPSIVLAGDTPDWEISYSYERDGIFVPIVDGGAYDIPLNVPITTAHTFPAAAAGWATVYKGVPGNAELMNHYTVGQQTFADSLETAPFRFGEGDYFLVIYDIGEYPNNVNFGPIIRQFTSSSTGIYPTSWGLIRFKIAKKPSCCSNVLFIPGFQASRLYERTSSGETLLWPPNTIQNSIYRLYLDDQGESLHDIYTKEDGVISHIATPFTTYHYYTQLITLMSALKASSTIQNFQTFPYDWRMDALDIVDSGTPYPNGRRFPITLLEELAATSQTGKVTIIGHSYGGIIAKAIAYRMSSNNKAHLIDRVILVGSPQLGTPKAAASLLHGDFQNIPSWAGFVMSKANARKVSENMKGAYNLLPSATFFDFVADPVINTTEAPRIEYQGGAGDSLVDNASEFNRFMTGAGGRQDPPYLSTHLPNVLSGGLLQSINKTQMLGSWNPTSTPIKFVQIAGWGLDTPKNIVYKEEVKTLCSKLTLQCSHATTTSHQVEMTLDGDGTVVLPSTIAMNDHDKYFFSIDLAVKNSDADYEHSNLLESPSLSQLFTIILSTTSPMKTLPLYIGTSTLHTSNPERLRLRMYSPVDVHVIDQQIRHTGKRPIISDPEFYFKEENIPGSYYEEIDEVKHIGLLDNKKYRIYLIGTDEGAFTFEIESVKPSSQSIVARYSQIPVTASTTAYLDLLPGGNMSALQIDVNGDGVIDENLMQGATISSETLIQMIVDKINQSVVAPSDVKHLVHDTDKIAKSLKLQSERDGVADILKQCEKLRKDILKLHAKGGVSERDGERILELLARIEEQII